MAIFWVYIPLHRPCTGLTYGRYLQFRILEWPLILGGLLPNINRLSRRAKVMVWCGDMVPSKAMFGNLWEKNVKTGWWWLEHDFFHTVGNNNHGTKYGYYMYYIWLLYSTKSLVGGDWNHGTLWLSIQLGMSSPQLTNSHFSEGLKPQPPTSENKANFRIHDPQI